MRIVNLVLVNARVLMIFHFVLWQGLVSFARAEEEQPKEQLRTDVEALLREIESLKEKREFAKKEDVDIFKRQLRAGLDVEASCLAAIQLSILGEYEFLELSWWRSDDRQVRVFCAAGVLLQKTGAIYQSNLIDGFLNGAGRFAVQEAAYRKEEILHIFRNKEKFNKLIDNKG